MQNSPITLKRKAYGYIRVSSDRQASEGESLETQRRAVELVCELEGFELVKVFADPAVSGAVPFGHRPEGSRLLSIAEPDSIIVGVRLDRVFRSAHDATGTLAQLKKKGIGLYLRDLGGDVTKGNVSALIFGLLANVAEFERSRIADRVAEVKKAQRAQSRFLGGDTPLGFRIEYDPSTAHLPAPKRILVPDDFVQLEARKLKAQGYSARLAAGHLIGLGHRATHKSVLNLWRTLGY